MDAIEFIRNFVYHNNDGDATGYYAAVYNPTFHPIPMSFWFNPPFDENGESAPSPSGMICVDRNGNVFVENFDDGVIYNITQCLGDTLENAVYAIQTLGQ